MSLLSNKDESEAKKLTLRIEGALIERAKRYASERGTSLSQLIADFFRAITVRETRAEKDEDDDWMQDLPPTTRSLVGIAAESNLDEDDYRRYLADKYR